jgi:RNA polymerase sigma factor (TIGR02999 family)
VADPGDVTRLLHAFRDGDRDALDRLVPLIYDDLRRIARSHVRRDRRERTLDTTALVHEAYLRLVNQQRASWEDRGHFLSVCARAMRQIVISDARRRTAAKRGGEDRPVTLNEELVGSPERAARVLELDQALERLGARDPRLARIVECRYFAGFTENETAEAIGVSVRTVQRDWRRARAWLRVELDDGVPGGGDA